MATRRKRWTWDRTSSGASASPPSGTGFARSYSLSPARGNNSARSDIDLAASGGDVAKFALDVDEEGRLDALESRNLMSHAHDDRVAPSIISKTREKYIFIFQEMEREPRESWSLGE